MNISWSEWLKYKNRLAAIDTKAADEMVSWLQTKGGYMNVSQEEISEYAYALATKYGEASAALSAQMYDEVAELSGAAVPAAEVANTATYGEVSNAIKYVTKTITTNKNIGNVVGKYTKQAGVDTTLKNAERDGAQFAWIPSGDSCPYCISLAAKGWQYMSKDAMKGGHASHIHANCDCTYATRFDDKTEVEGYDPKVYQDMYNSAEGNTPTEKINSMRRIQYQENKDKINAQKRANYNAKKKMEYRHVRDDNKTIVRSPKEGEVNAKQIVGSPNNIYVSNELNIKPKKLQEIENNVTEIKKIIGTEGKEEPTIILVADTEIGNAGGRYDAMTNTLYYKVIQDKQLQKHVNYHEMYHWEDAQQFLNQGKTIESNQQLIDYECKIHKEKLDKLGINIDNVGNISDYAQISYKKGRYDEVYTEYRTTNAIKRK